MATTNKAEIQARIDGIMQRLSTYTRKTPEYQAAVERLNDSLKLLGKPPVLANDLPDKSGYIAGRTPANVGSAPAQNAPATAPTAPSITDQTKLPPKVENLVDAQEVVADKAAEENFQLGTPGTQTNPFGTQTVTRDPVTGEVIVDQQLSDEQQGLLDQDEWQSKIGGDITADLLTNYKFGQGFDPNLTDRMTTGDLNADRARIEDEVFGRLTRGLGEQKANENQAMEQTLRNRGIPLGSKQWNDQMAEFNKRYDTLNADARAQAAQMGGEEFSRSFGIGEQLRANEYSEQANTRNQQIGETQQFSQFGEGLQLPQFQGYQSTQYQSPDVVGAYGTVTGANQGKTALQIERERIQAEKDMQAKALAQQMALSKPSGGGGGGGSTSSPFQA